MTNPPGKMWFSAATCGILTICVELPAPGVYGDVQRLCMRPLSFLLSCMCPCVSERAGHDVRSSPALPSAAQNIGWCLYRLRGRAVSTDCVCMCECVSHILTDCVYTYVVIQEDTPRKRRSVLAPSNDCPVARRLSLPTVSDRITRSG